MKEEQVIYERVLFALPFFKEHCQRKVWAAKLEEEIHFICAKLE